MYMLDTDICIYIAKRQPQTVYQRLSELSTDDVCISVITYAELVYGAMKSRNKKHNLEKISSLKSFITVLPFNNDASQVYGKIRVELERRGRLIGANDLLIAAHALSTNHTLVTNNENEFRRVKGLSVENWV